LYLPQIYSLACQEAVQQKLAELAAFREKNKRLEKEWVSTRINVMQAVHICSDQVVSLYMFGATEQL